MAIYIGNGEMVECAAGAGGVVKSKASDHKLIDIVHFDTPAGTPKAMIPNTTVQLTASSTAGTNSKYGFSAETEAIVEAHMNDFDYDNYDSFMEAHGGVENYIRSLGGIFTKWAGKTANVQTAGEFQEISEYIMGLHTIWGVDYRGGGGRHKFNSENGGEQGRFYAGMDAGPYWFDSGRPLEEVFENKRKMIVDCGSGITQIMRKAGLYTGGYIGMDNTGDAETWISRTGGTGGKIVTSKSDLQVGDVIQMFKEDGYSHWAHVCVIGEIWSDGTIIAYDTGNRYVRTANYKKVWSPDENGHFGGEYAGYKSWFGVRLRAIAQTGGISSGMGDSGIAVQNLGDIKINSVKVDGSSRNRGDFEYKTLGQYSEGGKKTTFVTKKFKFVDKDGNEMHMSGLASKGGMFGGTVSSTVDTSVGAGTEITIPEGLGNVHTYMGWQCITSPSSNQYKLRESAGQNFDSEGFGVINGRYVIACTNTYGKVGDYVDFVKADGKVLHCIIGDIKSRKDAGCNEWGHHNGRNIVEFVVDKDSWYGGHCNPGTRGCHPEWAQCITKAVNVGNYYGDTSSQFTLTSSSSGSDTENAMYLALEILSMSVIGSYYDQPHLKEPYQQYCFDLVDYAVCESGGADVEYTTTGEESMTCDVEVTIKCSMRELEKNDKNFLSWGYDHPSGDPQPASYMTLPIEVINEVFNINTFASAANAMPFTGNEEIVYEFFVSKGLGVPQIAGIMANIKGESSFNPKSVNSIGAKGLFQWLGGRAAALDKYAASQGKDWTDINCQLEYAWTEINDDKGWNGNSAQRKAFMSTTSAKEAGILFCTYWERPGSAQIAAKRGEVAEEYYRTIMSAGAGSSNINYVNWAIQIANDDSHGYSQDMYRRQGKPDYDCSSFVFYALKNAGYDVGNSPFSTYTMDGPLRKCGFQKISISSESDLRPGDILWRSEHTEIYIGNGKRVGAHSANGHPEPGDQDGDEVSVKDYNGGWYWAYRKG